MPLDRQLMLAAKACGFTLGPGWDSFAEFAGILVNGTSIGDGVRWNPRHVQGDSDRMGCKLGLDVTWGDNEVSVSWGSRCVLVPIENDDREVSIRLARLLAAEIIGAEI